MNSEFIAVDKAAEEAEWLRHFVEDIPRWPKSCQQCAYTVIANQQLEGHVVTCIMVSLDIYVVDTIPLDNYSQNRIVTIDYVKSKDNIADPLTKGLNRELVDKSSRGMGLKPMTVQVTEMETQPS